MKTAEQICCYGLSALWKEAAGVCEHHCTTLYLSLAPYWHIHTWRKCSTELEITCEGENTKGIALTHEDFSWTKPLTFQHRIPPGLKGTARRGWVLALYIEMCSNHIFQRVFSHYSNSLQCSVNVWSTTWFTYVCSLACCHFYDGFLICCFFFCKG